MTHAASLQQLALLDARIQGRIGVPASLGPGRERATPLASIGRALLSDAIGAERGKEFARVLSVLVEAQLENFPDTVFWDFDYPARCLLEVVERLDGDAVAFDEYAETLEQLERRFGVHSQIRFRYSHDFIYGFDWARWVRADVAERSGTGPFDPQFVATLHLRGAELLDLIAADDSKYPKLASGEPRNPFAFSREPGDEAQLHRALAVEGLVPVEAWRLDAEPSFGHPFSELRTRKARELGLLAD